MSSKDTLDELWEAFREGNKTAFGEIYRKYAPVLLSYGSKISTDHTLIEDSLQDLFIELWKSHRQLSSTTAVKFYLFKALRFKIYRNKSMSHGDDLEPIEDYMYILKDPSHEDHCIQLETESFQLQHLREALEKLPVRQREAINLRYFHNFSNEEIAGIMSVNYQSACKFIYAGLKALKEKISEERSRKTN